MVHVKLLENVAEGGLHLEKAIAAADAAGVPKSDRNYPRLKISTRHGRRVGYVKGAVVTMHEASAAKWLKRKLCEVVVVTEPA